MYIALFILFSTISFVLVIYLVELVFINGSRQKEVQHVYERLLMQRGRWHFEITFFLAHHWLAVKYCLLYESCLKRAFRDAGVDARLRGSSCTCPMEYLWVVSWRKQYITLCFINRLKYENTLNIYVENNIRNERPFTNTHWLAVMFYRSN